MIYAINLEEAMDIIPLVVQEIYAHYKELKEEELFFRKKALKPIVNSNKIGRNELCSCGSGKKYKKCCLNNPKY